MMSRPFVNTGRTAFFEECEADFRTLFFQAFGNGDDAVRIWDCGMIYVVNSFRRISLMSHFFRHRARHSPSNPDIKVGEMPQAICPKNWDGVMWRPKPSETADRQNH